MKKKNMKKLLLIAIVFFAMGWVGCPHDRYGRDDRRDNDRYERDGGDDRHDSDRYERDGRDDHEHDQDTEHH
jgi:hypothetical protein